MKLPSPRAARHIRMARSFPLAIVLMVPVAAVAQSLPATSPTTLAAPAAVGPIDATPVSRSTRPTVTYADGLLNVRASNASLQQILRMVSRQTGMQITGGVQEQRVFGNYGPADPSTVLATLLDGTGVNVLVHEDASHKPLELVMTPRGGGVSPSMASASPEDEAPEPSPATAVSTALTVTQYQTAPAAQTAVPAGTTANAASQNAVNQNANQNPTGQTPTGPQSMPQPLNNVLGNPNNTTPTASQIPTINSVPIDSLPTPSTTTQTAQGIVDSTNPPPAGTQNTGTPAPTTPTTPEQIYQQLLKLQQQKTAPTTPQ